MTDESEMFTRIVRVNRSQTPLQALEAFTNHKQYLTESVVSGMPLGTDEEVTLHFFPIKKGLSSAEFEAEFKKRNLKPDPMAQAEYNEKIQPLLTGTQMSVCGKMKMVISAMRSGAIGMVIAGSASVGMMVVGVTVHSRVAFVSSAPQIL